MPVLTKVSIIFNTHNNPDDNRNASTILHVFVKNRSNTSSDPEANTDFIGNLLAYQEHYNSLNTYGENNLNPYLAFEKSISQGVEFTPGSSHEFDLTLRSNGIESEEIILPVVNIHILPNGADRWKFDYSITFVFSDGKSFTSSSNTNGVEGIILDENNKDYSGICIENPYNNQIPQIIKPETDTVLTKVILEFGTHNDNDDHGDNKNKDTKLNVHITNRLSATSSQDIAIGINLHPNEEFPAVDPSDDDCLKTCIWPSPGFNLASNSIKLSDIVLPVIRITIQPNPTDRWMFDYRVTFIFSDNHTYSSRTNGIILDQDVTTYSGVYQGNPFPTVTPPTAPELSPTPAGYISSTKTISLSFLQQKLNEFINNRQGAPGQDPPIFKVRFHNSGFFWKDTLPESYLDVQSINSIKNSHTKTVDVNYKSSPRSLGQLNGTYFNIGELYLNDINSKQIVLNIVDDKLTPIYLTIDFNCDGPQPETIGGVGGMNFTKFYITLKLTLDCDTANGRIDVMSWVNNIEKTSDDDARDNLIHNVIDVQLETDNETWDPDGTFKKKMTNNIYALLTSKDIITRKTKRDDINSTANTILLGGVVDGDNKNNNNVVNSVNIAGNNLVITYSGPKDIFLPEIPADWPTRFHANPAYDFSPGTLAKIDHIVLLTMENRSFDHMLGYLSLPVSKGGMGRTDVDGLKGSESNTWNGTVYPLKPVSDTIFSPDPPHGYEPVYQAINSGKMDGFVKSYGEEHGAALAGSIMCYQPQANIPVYDALVRDFAICNRWFASHPGPTFCNRFYELTGRLNIDPEGFWEFDNSDHLRPAFTKTIFDHLNDYVQSGGENSGLTWKYFEPAYCFLRFFQKHTFDYTNIININDPLSGFFACAKNGTLPSVSYIDPHYIEMPPGANCDGPPADVKYGQLLVEQIVEAVIASPNWNKTMLIITYDEHGAFYDHVPPPPAVKVSDESPINTYGVRVPAFIISPWVRQGMVFGHDGASITPPPPPIEKEISPVHVAALGNPELSLHFDHTSILKTIARRFMSDIPPYISARFAAANDLSQVLGNTLRQTQFLPFIRYNIVYNASQKSLDVRGGYSTSGIMLWQFDVNNTPGQDFSFEDAGDGYFYIRTHCGNLYVTVDVPEPIIIKGSNKPLPPPTETATHNIKQDVKYIPSKTDLYHQPGYQKWKLTPASPLVADKDFFIITNAFFADKVLQPINNTQSGVAVVLGTDAGKNSWKITSPLLNSQVVPPIFK